MRIVPMMPTLKSYAWHVESDQQMQAPLLTFILTVSG